MDNYTTCAGKNYSALSAVKIVFGRPAIFPYLDVYSRQTFQTECLEFDI
ncbi:MAG: hypothetical protein M0R68_08285 [Bacteroidetes bacterium]|nr:hypothetical protein [Bacteroidota bacterium]